MPSFPFKLRSPSWQDWLLATALALVLGLSVGAISWMVKGRFEVSAYIVLGSFTGVVLNMMGVSMRERPGPFLAVMAVAAVLLAVLAMVLDL